MLCKDIHVYALSTEARSTLFKPTILDKSPWDSDSITAILCLSQVMSKKAVLSFYKSIFPPLPIQYNVARSKELCLDGFITVLGVGVGGRDVQC